MIFFIVWSCILGAAVGSFLNVVILRGKQREKLGGRSHCDACLKTLSPIELIPIISFLIQKGRCRHCKTMLSPQYPLVEIITAVFFGAAAYIWGNSFSAALQYGDIVIFLGILTAIAAGVVILVADLRWRMIPNGATLTLFMVGVLAEVYRTTGFFLSALLGGGFHSDVFIQDIVASLAATLFLGALWFFSKGRAMGFGDVKLVFATSLILGYPASAAALLFAFWLGGFAGIVLLIAGKKSLKSQIPFGPFILAGAAIAVLYADIFFAQSGLLNIMRL